MTLSNEMLVVPGDAPEDDGYTWTRLPADEFWGGPCSPFSFSWLGELCQRHGYDWIHARQGQSRLVGFPGFRIYRSHVYWNADLLAMIYEGMPQKLRTDRLLAAFPPDERDGVRRRPFDGRNMLRGQLRFAASVPACTMPLAARTWGRHSARYAPFMHEIRHHPPDVGDAKALIAAYHASWTYQAESFHIAASSIVMHATSLITALAAAVQAWAGVPDDGIDATMARLLSGTEGNLTAATSEGLHQLVQEARRVPGLLDTPAMDAVRSRAGSGPFLSRLDEFLEVHGHRSENRDVIYPRWHEDPTVVLLAVGGMLNSERAVKVDAAGDAAAAREEMLSSAGATKRKVLGRLLDVTRRFVELRDNGRYWGDRGFDAARQIVRRSGIHLAQRGVLDDPELVYFLRKEEMLDGLHGWPKPELATMASRRREQYELDRQSRPPAWLRGGHAYDLPLNTAADGVLSGVAACPGIVTGVARVLRTLDDADRLEPGDVLVADNTDPGWTPLFSLASAVVLEASGLLSHGPIVAREYGLPCVVGIRGVTALIPDGAKVMVDGVAGTVSIL